jgi:hypothetical protein
MIKVVITPQIRKLAVAATTEMKLVCLRLSKVVPVGRHASRRTSMTLHCYTTTSPTKKGGDGDAESLLDLMTFKPPAVSFVFVISLM